MAKNFTSMPPWLPGIVTACLSLLTYSIQLNDGRVWKRHMDHIQETEEREKQSSISEGVESELEDWSYSIPVEDEHSQEFICDQIWQNVHSSHTIWKHRFHRHSIATSIN